MIEYSQHTLLGLKYLFLCLLSLLLFSWFNDAHIISLVLYIFFITKLIKANKRKAVRIAIQYDKKTLKRCLEIARDTVRPTSVASLLITAASEYKALTADEISTSWLRSKASENDICLKEYVVVPRVKTGKKTISKPRPKKNRSKKNNKSVLTKPSIHSLLYIPKLFITSKILETALAQFFELDYTGKRYITYNYQKGKYSVEITQKDLQKNVWDGIISLYNIFEKDDIDTNSVAVKLWSGK